MFSFLVSFFLLFFHYLFLCIPSALGMQLHTKGRKRSENEAEKRWFTWTALQIISKSGAIRLASGPGGVQIWFGTNCCLFSQTMQISARAKVKIAKDYCCKQSRSKRYLYIVFDIWEIVCTGYLHNQIVNGSNSGILNPSWLNISLCPPCVCRGQYRVTVN